MTKSVNLPVPAPGSLSFVLLQWRNSEFPSGGKLYALHPILSLLLKDFPPAMNDLPFYFISFYWTISISVQIYSNAILYKNPSCCLTSFSSRCSIFSFLIFIKILKKAVSLCQLHK